MNKKLALLFALIACIGVAVFFLWEKKQVAPSPAIKFGDDIQLTAEQYELKEINQSKVSKLNAVDTTYTYDVNSEKPVGTLTLTVRKVDNGDRFVFSQFYTSSEEGVYLPLQLTFADQTDFDFFKISEELVQEEHDRVFGKDYTTNVKGIYSFKGKKPYDLILSQNYISHELEETYSDGTSSVLRELVNEDDFLEINKDNGNVTFNMKLRTTGPEQFSESWFLLSDDSLFPDKEEAQYYKNYSNRNFIHSPKWQTASGIYTKLPWSVEPGTKLGYGRNLVSQQGKVFAGRYQETPARFYYDMLVNSVNYLFDFKGELPIWKTEYTSTWLKREYGITAPYIDTRHNENIALFLSSAGNILANKEIADSDLLYADFLSSQKDIGNTLSTKNGYYILDYYSENQSKKTHVSLNHALGEMNFLMESYEKNKIDSYLETALRIKRALEDTGEQWINDSNGDLWYQINGDYSFEGQDYDTLTLEDLINSLQNFNTLRISYSQEIFDALIKSKIEYIKEQGIQLHQLVYDDLLTLGFGPSIQGYEHVYNY
ncbi:hypothetical protein [Sporosarcina sp.]|uniref:hypothetical protein n=1 Tax=Sporosarcina sp. TaxID=49982 RepID=UPI002633E659|nr:hypothetical protein [Sporosarcina sp.]